VNFRKRFDFLTYTLRYTVISFIKSENGNLMGRTILGQPFLSTTDDILLERRGQHICDLAYQNPSKNILEHFTPQVIAVSPQQNSLSGENRFEDTFSRL
jgi:hypothetical protein